MPYDKWSRMVEKVPQMRRQFLLSNFLDRSEFCDRNTVFLEFVVHTSVNEAAHVPKVAFEACEKKSRVAEEKQL